MQCSRWIIVPYGKHSANYRELFANRSRKIQKSSSQFRKSSICIREIIDIHPGNTRQAFEKPSRIIQKTSICIRETLENHSEILEKHEKSTRSVRKNFGTIFILTVLCAVRLFLFTVFYIQVTSSIELWSSRWLTTQSFSVKRIWTKSAITFYFVIYLQNKYHLLFQNIFHRLSFLVH